MGDERPGDGDGLDQPVAPLLAFVLAPLVTFVLVAAATTLLPGTAPLTYYQTVAFLVPSLLVTLALQGQFFRMSDTVPPPRALRTRHPALARVWLFAQRTAAVVLLLYLAAGEITGLYVLAAQRPGAVAFAITAGSVTTAFVALGVVALLGTPWKRGRT